MAMIDNNSCDSGRKDLVELVNGGGAHEKRRSTQELSEDEPRGPDVLEADESHRITADNGKECPVRLASVSLVRFLAVLLASAHCDFCESTGSDPNVTKLLDRASTGDE